MSHGSIAPQQVPQGPPPEGDPRFHAILAAMAETHAKKVQDYGDGEGDFLSNLRASERMGLPAWKGVLLRMNDKMTRMNNFAKNGSLANESFEDSLLDTACYAVLGLILFREATEAAAKGGQRV